MSNDFDMVKKPEHYNFGKIQVWDWIELGLTDEEFKGYLKGNIYKYTQRYSLKGGSVDLDKLEQYKKRLKAFEEGQRVRWYYADEATPLLEKGGIIGA